ncbi:carbon-nitrogen hydrolase family protein, partial [Vibrio parahaemolyticus V-223/04]
AVSATYRAWTTWTFNMLNQRCSHLQTFISPTMPH